MDGYATWLARFTKEGGYPLRGYETLRGDRQWQDKRRLLGLG